MHYFKFYNRNSNAIDIVCIATSSSMTRTLLLDKFIQPIQDKIGLCNILVVEAPKGNAKALRTHFEELKISLANSRVKYIFCNDNDYFKFNFKANLRLSIGEIFITPGLDAKILPTVPFSEIYYSQDSANYYLKSLEVFHVVTEGNYYPPSSKNILANSIFYHRHYGNNNYITTMFNQKQNIYNVINLIYLDRFKDEPIIYIDIEAFSLKHFKGGISTISFAKNKEEAHTLYIHHPRMDGTNWNDKIYFKSDLEEYFILLNRLKNFFINFKGKFVFHNSGYDVKQLIYVLFMKDINDREGLWEGFNVFKGKIEDTLLMAYLTRNSTNKNKIGLKYLAQEFSGDYGIEEIKDITRIDIRTLMEYNAIDALSTAYVHEKLKQEMDEGNFWDLYYSLLLPYQELIIYTELCGIPVDPKKVNESAQMLEKKMAEITTELKATTYYQEAQLLIQQDKLETKNKKRVKKKTLADIPIEDINYNSDAESIRLIYDVLAIPVVERSAKTKKPSLKADVIEKYLNWDSIPDDKKKILSLYIEYQGAQKIMSTFLKALQEARPSKHGYSLLFGSFNSTATISGRLSSSNPNLQNLPSKGFYGKLIKDCFISPPGFLFGGADFNSLEDYISALQTKDPNKLKVYLEGYDGHSLRAYYYYPDVLGHLNETPESINTIKVDFEDWRQDSKAPTFALTYQGTFKTLMTNLGWPEDKAKAVEANYKKLYQVSIDWVNSKLDQAIKDGYVTLAFGLRLLTPALHNSDKIRKSKNIVEQERRSAGNALGQSYCMLNNRSALAFMQKVWADPVMYNKIFPAMYIHDASYFVWENSPEVTKFVNDNLIQEMQWQELPDIQHDQVKIGGALDIFYPTWKYPHELKNNASLEDITAVIKDLEN